MFKKKTRQGNKQEPKKSHEFQKERDPVRLQGMSADPYTLR